MEEFKSIFGDYTKEVQLRIDAASQKRKQLFDTNYIGRFFDWGIPMMGTDFTALMGKYGITIAAATIDENSPSPVIGTQGADIFKGNVFNHAITIPLTMAQRRQILAILDSRRIDDKTKAEQIAKLMMGGVVDATNGVYARLNMIFLSALSNKGKFSFSDDNNPEGAVRDLVNFRMPDENIASVTKDWTSGNADTVDVFEDIQAVVDRAANKVVFDRIMLSQSRLSYILKSKAFKQVVFGKDKSGTPLLLNGLNDFMQANELPVFEVVRNQCRIPDGKGGYKMFTPWNDKTLAFVPSGKLGVIENSYADGELEPENGVTYSKTERILVSQWSVGKAQGSHNRTDFTSAESLSLPVINEIGAVYNLTVEA